MQGGFSCKHSAHMHVVYNVYKYMYEHEYCILHTYINVFGEKEQQEEEKSKKS